MNQGNLDSYRIIENLAGGPHEPEPQVGGVMSVKARCFITASNQHSRLTKTVRLLKERPRSKTGSSLYFLNRTALVKLEWLLE